MIMRRFYLYLECAFLVAGLPYLLWATADRVLMLTALWGGGFICLLYLLKNYKWREVWAGAGLDNRLRKTIIMRFAILTAVSVGLTILMVPERFFAFPMDRTQMWALVMLLYPVLSALPQEIIYRAFFFRRYAGIIQAPDIMVTLSAIAFGLSHLMMNNWVAPLFCIFGGMIFGLHYTKHRSLKWAAIEHAAYGCMIFTVGLGYYFYIGNWR
jgi:uncharacterized protein